MLGELLTGKGWSGNQFSKLIGAAQATVAGCLRDERSPPEGRVEAWAAKLGLRGEERLEFLRLAEELRARRQTKAGAHIKQLEDRVAFLEALALRIGRKAIQRGVELDEESRQFLDSLEKQ